jgi:hypothetical protein
MQDSSPSAIQASTFGHSGARIDDERDLLGKKARVDRVTHGADARRAVIALQMPITVPGQCADPVTRSDIKADQRLRQLFGAFFAIAVGVSMNIAFDTPRDDFSVAEMA